MARLQPMPANQRDTGGSLSSARSAYPLFGWLAELAY